MRWPLSVTALGLSKAPVLGTLSLMVVLRALGPELIVAPRPFPRTFREARWYVFSQDSDCTSGLREARRRARQQGMVPSSVSLVLLGGTSNASTDSSAWRVSGWRRRTLLWLLWSRGAQRTPFLLRYSHWYSFGRLEHLSPDPATILENAPPPHTIILTSRRDFRWGSH